MTVQPAPTEAFLAPSGYYVVIRPDFGSTKWVVRVLNFASWKHINLQFTDEETARRYFDQYRL